MALESGQTLVPPREGQGYLNLVPFALEDFFYEYEHRDDLVNLASSDSHPWTLKEMKTACPDVSEAMDELGLGYPNVKRLAIPALRAFHNASEGKDVLPTSGTADAIFVAFLWMIVNARGTTSMAIPYPSYGAFDGIAKLLGFNIRPYFYRRDHGWTPDAEILVELAKRCEVIVINNPHNPTGQLMDPRLLGRIANAAASHGGTLFVDEVFRLPEDTPSSLELHENVIVVGSLSKVYGLPGLRFGWIAGSADRIRRMRTLQQYLTLSLNSFAAALGAVVLEKPERFSRRDLLLRNRGIVTSWANEHHELLTVLTPRAGTTAILEVLKPLAEGLVFDAFLKEKVLLVPGGKCFGPTDRAWFRLGYGTETEVLLDGLRRIVATLESL